MDFQNIKKKVFRNKKSIINWVLSLWIIYVFVVSLPYKFTNSEVTQHIFGTIGEWMGTNFLSVFSVFFANYGGYTIGVFELVASILLLMRNTRIYGAILALSLMSGAIYFHLFTPLGIDIGDGGSLFISACLVWISSIILIIMNHKTLPLKK